MTKENWQLQILPK